MNVTQKVLTPKFKIVEFDLKTLETSFSGIVQSLFWYLEPFRHDSWMWWTDGQTNGWTDILLANATLNYIAGQKW